MAIVIRELTPLLEVFDLPASLAFYRDVLGFAIASSNETSWCMLKLGDATLMLNTAYEPDERPPEPQRERVRGHGDTSLFFSSPDPDAVHALLERSGWAVTEPTITPYGMRQVSTRDPDGFRLFFSCPAPFERPEGDADSG